MLIIISTGVGLIVVGGLIYKTTMKIRKLNRIEKEVEIYMDKLAETRQLMPYNSRSIKEIVLYHKED